MTKKYSFELYITGYTINSKIVIQNLNQIFYEQFKNECTLEVIDVLKNPLKAETEKILATPTLILKSPPPVKRFIGNLSNREDILVHL